MHKAGEKQIKKYLKEVAGFNIFEMMIILCDSFEQECSDVKYSKNFFCNYYSVDNETFNKWIQIFCPTIWNDQYSSKRKFSNEEALLIYESLGRFTAREVVPRNRQELGEMLFKDETFKRSKIYDKIEFLYSEKLPTEALKINNLPPKIMNEILEELMEDYKSRATPESQEIFSKKIFQLQQVITKYQTMSEHQKAVRKRYFSIWFQSSNKFDD